MIALLNHQDIVSAWMKEYNYQPSNEDIETLYNLLKFVEDESGQKVSMTIENAVSHFNEHHKADNNYVMSSKNICISEWKPDVKLTVNGLIINIDYAQQAIAIMNKNTFDQCVKSQSSPHEALSLSELCLLMKLLEEKPEQFV